MILKSRNYIKEDVKMQSSEITQMGMHRKKKKKKGCKGANYQFKMYIAISVGH